MCIGSVAGGSAFIENAGAGASVGQDHSERAVQFAGAMPQFFVGKFFPGFGPFGPYIVTLDEFDDSSSAS